MADEEVIPDEDAPKKGKGPMMMIALIAVVIIAAAVVVFSIKKGETDIAVSKPVAEYVVKEKMYQLKDGSYLRLGFTVVCEADDIEAMKQLIEQESPGRLPDGIHMLVGNKARDDLIRGSHKREAFTRELKKMLEEQVFGPYNKDKPPSEAIQVRDVLITDFVTQSG